MTTHQVQASPQLLSRGFVGWLGAATIAGVGDGVLYFAIGWTAAGLGPGTAGIVLTLVLAPRTALMLVGGAAGDRWGLRRTMVGCDLVMCVVLGGVLVATSAPVPTIAVLVVLAVALGVVSAFRMPAASAFPRVFVDDDRLPQALSLTGSLLQVARLVGPPLGGVVLGVAGMPGAVTLALAAFALMALVLVLVKPPRQVSGAVDGSTLSQVGEALRSAGRVPGTWALLGAVALLAAAVIPMLTLCVPLAARERGWSAATTGLVESAWIVGSLGVSLLVARFGARQRPIGPLTLGPVLVSAGVLVIAASPAPTLALVGAGVMGVGTAAFTIHALPLYVQRTPDGMLARFQGLLGFAQAAPMLVTNNLLGAVASSVGVVAAMVVVAVLTLAAGVLVSATTSVGRPAGATDG